MRHEAIQAQTEEADARLVLYRLGVFRPDRVLGFYESLRQALERRRYKWIT